MLLHEGRKKIGGEMVNLTLSTVDLVIFACSDFR